MLRPQNHSETNPIATWRRRARRLKRETHALCLAMRDPRTPLQARLLAAGVVAYALSPIDLIPDFIPVLGYLDDLVLVPLGIALTLKLIPPEVLAEARARAEDADRPGRPRRWVAAAIVGAIWLLSAALAAYLILQLLD
jgi:uncharacterized membrane protein YkvA (DUF1232 family)